jgi:DNA-binding transcriptional LysR family regulator
MTINQLKYFLTLAQTLNYTKASKQLYLTQSHLSKTIVTIEQEIGVQLFIRSKRNVRLTQAGELFYAEISNLVSTFDSIIDKTKDAHKGVYGIINVGFSGMAMIRLLPTIINRFRRAYPNISLNLFDYIYSSLQDALYTDKFDVAILPDRELNDIVGFEKRHLISDDMCVVVHKDHPVAERNSVELRDFKNDPIIIMDPTVSACDSNMVTSMCLEQGFLPNTTLKSNTVTNILMMVECNMGVSVLARHMTHMATENVRFINIAGYENYFKLVCAWRKDKNPCVEQFVTTAFEYCREVASDNRTEYQGGCRLLPRNSPVINAPPPFTLSYARELDCGTGSS